MTIGVAILDMDGTLLSKRSIDVFCTELGLTSELDRVDRISPSLPAYETSEMIASFFKGTKRRTLENLLETIPMNEGAEEFVRFLKSEGFLVAIATDSYQFLAQKLAGKIRADAAYGNLVELRNGSLTGKLLTQRRCLKVEGCRQYSPCKLWFMQKLREITGGITVAVGDSDSDFCAVSRADIGIAYRPKRDSIVAVAEFAGSDYSEVRTWLRREIGHRQYRTP
jgi:phosphoserine phosphatase